MSGKRPDWAHLQTLFYTNASECVNSMIKNKVQYKRNELPQFIQKLKELCDEQQREVERAVVCRGKYRLRPQYRHLEVPESKWFTMSREQRKQHLSKVNDHLVSNTSHPDEVRFSSGISCTSESCSDSGNVSVSSLLKQLTPLSSRLNLPITAVEGIARKAIEITNTDSGIVQAPGHDPSSRMVISKSGKRPHLVTPKKNGGMACDSDCLQYKSACICSHVVAAAGHNKMLDKLIASYQKSKHTPNLTALALGKMHKGRGRKGSRAPPKRKKPVLIKTRVPMQIPAHCSALNIMTSTSSTVSTQVTNSITFTGVPGMSQSLLPSFVPYPQYHPMSSSYVDPLGGGQHQYHPMSSTYVDPLGGGQHPFRLCLITGNISVCHGCKARYNKDLGPPHDFCVQHDEWHTYNIPGSVAPQSRFGNVYYHCN